MTHFIAEAPSNIALIKYMGKRVGADSVNVPVNSSLSLTLPEFRSRVEIRSTDLTQDTIEPLVQANWVDPNLSEKGRQKFLNFFARLKETWGIVGSYTLGTANNFPADCGVASSASSFAALTMATYELAKSQNPQLDLTKMDLAEISRQGSGSSCRSFIDGLVLWNKKRIESIDITVDWHHELILLDQAKKEVSSSEAHQRVTESSMFVGRPERAELRLQQLLPALKTKPWPIAWQLVWDEFWDMHVLFHTAKPPFQYMTLQTHSVLNFLRQDYLAKGDGPLVTMDAGANIHLLYRTDQKSIWPKLSTAIPGLKCSVGRKATYV